MSKQQLFHVQVASGSAPVRSFAVAALSISDALTNIELALGDRATAGDDLYVTFPQLNVQHMGPDDQSCDDTPYSVRELA